MIFYFDVENFVINFKIAKNRQSIYSTLNHTILNKATYKKTSFTKKMLIVLTFVKTKYCTFFPNIDILSCGLYIIKNNQ